MSLRFHPVLICLTLCIASISLLFLPTCHADNVARKKQFLALSDIHFDPFITCSATATTCPIIQQLETAPAEAWKAILATHDTAGIAYGQDTNYPLFDSTLTALQTVAAKQQPSYVLILGDYLAHRYRDKYERFASDKSAAGYQQFVKKTLAFLTQEINAAFPTTDVFFAVGNNDSDIDDYRFAPHGSFFQNTAPLIASAIKNPQAQHVVRHDFSVAGYYAVTLPNQPHLRLIVLNSNLFSNRVNDPAITAAANAQLNWLEQQFVHATTFQQHVLLVMHIPAGIDMYSSLKQNPVRMIEHWQPIFTDRFDRILAHHANRIRGILAAHEHSDWLRVLHYDRDTVPVIGIPSISAANKNNPAFKLFSMQPVTDVLVDYTKYFYPINRGQTWQVEYRFNETYQPHCQSCQLQDGIMKINQQTDLAESYQNYYDAESQADIIHTYFQPFYACQLQAMTLTSYQQCLAER